jgi:hypothetical protein
MARSLAKNGEPLKPIQPLANVTKINQGLPKMATNNNTTINYNKYIDFLAYKFIKKRS